MPRSPSPSPVHGWLFLDKPEGMTSTQAVSFVRRACGTRKGGHAGTLDPLASGVLPIALGEATKTVPFMMDAVKAYGFTVQWGSATTTGDREGSITTTSPHLPTAGAIADALPEFHGVIQQRPHSFSAIKVNGERAYDLARAGEIIELPARPVVIHALSLTTHDGPTSAFVTTCGKGTYIRSLAQDLALRLGTFGHIVHLRRLRVGPVTETDLVTPEQLTLAGSVTERQMFLHPVHRVLDDIPALDLTDAAAHRVRHGQSVLIAEAVGQSAPAALVRYQGQAVAIGMLTDGQFAPSRVFNLA